MSELTSILLNNRKPLQRIYINPQKENLNLSNVEDYFPIDLAKKKKLIQRTQSNPVSVYNLRPRSSRDVLREITIKPSITEANYSFLSLISNIPFHTNPQYACDYFPDIIQHYHSLEKAIELSYGYMSFQKEINQKMRAILIDWLVDVHLKFKLMPETLYLAVNIIDRFLSKFGIERTRLQLVGITSLFIACKYEEIYPPEIKDHVYITDKAYTKMDIIKMEQNILEVLEYNISYPSSLRFLEVYFQSTIGNFSNELQGLFLFAQYIIELTLIEYNMLKYTSGEISLSAYYIAYKIKQTQKELKLEYFCDIFQYNEDKLRECAKEICGILEHSENNSLQAVIKKFSSEKFSFVANWNTKLENSHYENEAI